MISYAFINDKLILEYLESMILSIIRKIRWAKGVFCPNCLSKNIKKHGKAHYNKDLQRYKCNNCYKTFCDTTNTIFAYSKTGLYIAFLISKNFVTERLSIRYISWNLHKSYNCIYRLVSKVLEVIAFRVKKVVGGAKFQGTNEIDEFYVKAGYKGQKGLPRPSRKRGIKLKGRGTYDKDVPPCFMIVNRESRQRRVYVSMNADEQTVKEISVNNIEVGSKIYTDEFSSYNVLEQMGYKHFRCNHSEKEYVKDGVHVNGCEGYTSVIRTKMRNHNGVNKQNLNSYLNVCVLSSKLRSMDVEDAEKELLKWLLGLLLFYISHNLRNKSSYLIHHNVSL